MRAGRAAQRVVARRLERDLDYLPEPTSDRNLVLELHKARAIDRRLREGGDHGVDEGVHRRRSSGDRGRAGAQRRELRVLVQVDRLVGCVAI